MLFFVKKYRFKKTCYLFTLKKDVIQYILILFLYKKKIGPENRNLPYLI